jgi:hypothetical protein
MELPYLITGLVHYVCGHELRISSGKQRRSDARGRSPIVVGSREFDPPWWS